VGRYRRPTRCYLFAGVANVIHLSDALRVVRSAVKNINRQTELLVRVAPVAHKSITELEYKCRDGFALFDAPHGRRFTAGKEKYGGTNPVLAAVRRDVYRHINIYFIFEVDESAPDMGINVIGKAASADAALRLFELLVSGRR
jgi:hypothetical protein